MLRFRSQTLLHRIAMVLALVLTLSVGASAATGNPPCGPPGNPCSESAQYVVTDALPSAVSGWTGSSQHEIIGARMPTAGPLTYEDLRLLEKSAWNLLTRNREFRRDISPHNERPNFEDLVQQFDYESGFNRVYTGTQTLQAMLDSADSELRRARDIYAYLAVYADEARFRADRIWTAHAAPRSQ
jgi:hypothetical protein